MSQTANISTPQKMAYEKMEYSCCSQECNAVPEVEHSTDISSPDL